MSDVYFNVSMKVIEEITFQINYFTLYMNSVIYLDFLTKLCLYIVGSLSDPVVVLAVFPDEEVETIGLAILKV